MGLDSLDFFGLAVAVSFAMLSVAFILAFIRLAWGPSLPDRVVALDLIAFLAIGFVATYTIASDQPALLEAATALALIAFLGTIAFARYIQQAARGRKGEMHD